MECKDCPFWPLRSMPKRRFENSDRMRGVPLGAANSVQALHDLSPLIKTAIKAITFFLALRLFASSEPDPAGYIGSKSCFGCHQRIYRDFSKTDMGNSARLAEDVQVPATKDSGVAEGTSGKVLRIFRDGNNWYQSESEAGAFNEQYKLEYAIGSGVNGITFLVRRSNYLFQAPLSFYSKTAKWELSPGYENTETGFTRVVPEACLTCHTGQARPVANRSGEYADPPFQELAIGCENCHGPGASHAASPSRSGSITNPARLPPRLAEDICMDCHQRGDARVLQPGKKLGDFRPGQPLLETLAIFKVVSPTAGSGRADLLEHDSAMKASRCFRATGGKLSCFTCHDPHFQPRGSEAAAYYRAKCLTCHTDASCTLARQERLKQDPQDSCTGCHMPKRDVAGISHSALTNHRIPASATGISPAPENRTYGETGLILIDAPFSKQAPVQEITLLRAYAELTPQYPSFQQRYLDLLQHLSQTQPTQPLVEAALGHKALAEGHNEEALTYLKAAISLGEAQVYADLAKALSNVGKPDEALSYLKHAAEDEPFNSTIQKTLILRYISSKRYSDAREAMEQYMQLFPGDNFMRNLLSRAPK